LSSSSSTTAIIKKKKYNFYNNYLNGTTNNNNEIGILSMKDPSFFNAYQDEIDTLNDITRCERYGFVGVPNENNDNNDNEDNNEKMTKNNIKNKYLIKWEFPRKK
jgi:hypothetical protein